MKKLIILLLLLLLVGCKQTNTDNKPIELDYDLSFSDSDIDYSYNEDEAQYIELGNKDINIDTKGIYVLSGTLNNASIIIDTKDEVKLVLNNANINTNSFACIYVKKAKKVTITTLENTINTFNDTDKYSLIDDEDVDAVIYSKDDLVFNGDGVLNINANYQNGIVSKDNVVITNGTININAKNQGIKGKDSIKIKDGTININSKGDALKSNNEDGFIYIASGNIDINAVDDAIQAYTLLQIDDGNINISESKEGLEARYVIINDGDISIVSKDDGINASDSSLDEDETYDKKRQKAEDAYININGGNIYINAQGDGVDSNGDIYLNGGTLYIDGPDDSLNNAFDYETGGYAFGTEVLMIGASGMAREFSKGSDVCNVLYNTDKVYDANTSIVITNDNNEIIFEHTSAKPFDSLVFTSSKMNVDENIKIKLNDDIYEFTLNNTINIFGQLGKGKGMGPMSPDNMKDFRQVPPKDKKSNGPFEPNQ